MTYEEACDRGYDGPPPGWERRNRHRYSCGDGMCGALDCYRCRGAAALDFMEEDRDKEAIFTKDVVARKARHVGNPWHEIRPGDLVRVISGFYYKEGGPRTGYMDKEYHRLKKGPAWEDEQ
jgi:hypothetical protein